MLKESIAQKDVETNKNNKIRLAKYLKQDMPKIVKTINVNDDKETLYYYNETHYDVLTDNKLRDKISVFMTTYDIEKKFTSSGVKDIILALKHLPDIPVVEMDQDRMLLNVDNGTLNVGTLKLSPHSDDIYLSYCMDVEYDPTQTDATNFLEFLSSTFTNDDGTPDNNTIINMLMIGGYLLYPINTLNMMFIFLGDGANGKSIYLDTIASFFPEKYTTGLSLKRLSKDEGFGRSEIKNSRLNIATETKGGEKNKVDAEELKRIINSENITLSQKYTADITIKPQTKLALASNDRPYFNDTSHGAWRRFFFVEFKNMFVDEWVYGDYKNPEKHRVYKKMDYMELFKSEKTAIFNLLLQSAHKLKESGWKLQKSQNTLDIEAEYKKSADATTTFLSETYEVINDGPNEFTTPKTFSDIYEDYTIDYRQKHPGDNDRYLAGTNGIGSKIMALFRIKPIVLKKRDENGKPTTTTSYNLKYKSYENENKNDPLQGI